MNLHAVIKTSIKEIAFNSDSFGKHSGALDINVQGVHTFLSTFNNSQKER